MNDTSTYVTNQGRGCRIQRKIELAANVAMIVIALTLGALFLKKYESRSDDVYHPFPVGSIFGLTDMNWQTSSKTVVLGLSTTCHVCADSAPFYRRIVDLSRSQHVRVLAILPQPVDQATLYLKGEGVIVDEIRQVDLQGLKMRATPTVVLVDNGGIVQDVQVGKLPPSEENQILAELSSR